MHNKIIGYKKKDFSYAFNKNIKLAANNHFYRGLYVSLYIIKERYPEKCSCHTIRLGIAVSKKIGKATKRNKIKRRLKALARFNFLNKSSTKNNLAKSDCFSGNSDKNKNEYYYIILAHKNIMQASYQNLQKDLTICLERIK